MQSPLNCREADPCFLSESSRLVIVLGQATDLIRLPRWAEQKNRFGGNVTMTRLKNILASSLVAVTMTAAFAATEQAAAVPFGGGVPALSKDAGAVTHVYWRGHGWGWGPGALIGGIVGGAIIAAAVSEHRAAPRDMDRCARDYPDFSYRTGTYIDRRGDERVCPYLR
jgi:hypothetical protein